MEGTDTRSNGSLLLFAAASLHLSNTGYEEMFPLFSALCETRVLASSCEGTII